MRGSINRNIVECKATWVNYHITRVGSINRNIVECKDGKTILISFLLHCINRNIVECKESDEIRATMVSAVLIETLWNVKTIKSITPPRAFKY